VRREVAAGGLLGHKGVIFSDRQIIDERLYANFVTFRNLLWQATPVQKAVLPRINEYSAHTIADERSGYFS